MYQEVCFFNRMKSCVRFPVAGLFLLFFSFGSPVFSRPGDLDAGFGANGKVVVPVRSSANDGATKVALQTDGKIVVAGYAFTNSRSDFAVARFNPTGAPDASFGTNGVVVTSLDGATYASSVVIQPDGKILIAGNMLVGETNDFALFRFNSNGTPDAAFGAGGLVTTPINAATNDYVSALLLQPDGKIIAAGTSFGSAGSASEFAIARYTASGALDATFSGDGKATTQFHNQDRIGNAALRADGKIAVAGTTFDAATQQTSIALASYNADGTPDATFDGDGKATTAVSNVFEYYVGSLAIQTDGKLIVAGTAPNYTNVPFTVARFTPTGALDPTFDGDGKTEIAFGANGGNAWTLALQTDGKIVVAGGMLNARYDFAVARLNSNGSPDRGFGANGRVVAFVGNSDDQIYGLAVQPDGKIVASGYSGANGDTDFAIARFLGGDGFAPAAPFDFDADGRADVSVFRPSNGTWYLQRSQTGFAGIAFGAAGDLIAPADFDGDGRTDIAVFRPSNGYWYILNSSNNEFRAVQSGASGDVPRAADFDGDDKADLAVFRSSNGTWFRINSANNALVETRFGAAGDVPFPADFDGDGRADINVFRPSNGTWYRLNSSNGAFIEKLFGTNGDVPAAADYDGDGRADIAVFRPSNGTWYRTNSFTNAFVAVSFGTNGDVPTAADYDGDGKADVAVFRPSNGTWYRLNSTNNAFVAETFGATGDKPVPSAFAP
jgi:uncharacterized delta-60 repeat protein